MANKITTNMKSAQCFVYLYIEGISKWIGLAQFVNSQTLANIKTVLTVAVQSVQPHRR